MQKNTIKYVGFDTHKNTIVIAIADEKGNGEVRNYGTIPNTLEAVDKFIRRQIPVRHPAFSRYPIIGWLPPETLSPILRCLPL